MRRIRCRRSCRRRRGRRSIRRQVRASVRRLFASGRYRDISVRGVRQGDAVTLIFTGVPRYYVGRVTIDGVKNDRLASLLEFATKLSPGTAFNESQIPAGAEGIKEILEQQGYYESDGVGDVAGRCCGQPGKCNVYGCNWAAGAGGEGDAGWGRIRD